VRARRDRAARLASSARRAGYGLLVLAGVVFAVGLAWRLTTVVTVIVMACLVAGSVVLAPAIVVGYGVRAAEREEREERAVWDDAPPMTKGDQ
jgi:hypothetical protein